MNRKIFLHGALTAFLLIAAYGSASATQISLGKVEVGACVPPYMYIDAPDASSAHSSNARIAFFAVDCNSADTYLIALDGRQYKLKRSGAGSAKEEFPTGSYAGDGIAVTIQRGKLIHQNFEGRTLVSEEFDASVLIKLESAVGEFQSVYWVGH